MRERVLVNKAIKVLLERASDFVQLPRSETIKKAWGSLLIKAMHPLSHCRVGTVEAVRDLLHASAFDDFANCLNSPKDLRFFGLLDEGL